MSHLATAEVVGSAVTWRQRERFADALQVVVNRGVAVEWLHLGATSAVDEGSTLRWMQELAAGVGGAGDGAAGDCAVWLLHACNCCK